MTFDDLMEAVYRAASEHAARHPTPPTVAGIAAALRQPESSVARAVAALQKDWRLTRCGMQPTTVGEIWLHRIRTHNAHLKLTPIRPRKQRQAS